MLSPTSTVASTSGADIYTKSEIQRLSMCCHPWQPQRAIAPMDYKYVQRSANLGHFSLDFKYAQRFENAGHFEILLQTPAIDIKVCLEVSTVAWGDRGKPAGVTVLR